MKSRFKLTVAVYVIFRKGNKVLLLKRKNTGYHDGDYSLVAGHIEGGESLKDAACREALEEVGAKISSKDLALVHILHRRSDEPENINERLDFYFEVIKWLNKLSNKEPEKCEEIIWVNQNKIPANTVPHVSRTLRLIQKGDSYSSFGWEGQIDD